LNKMEMFVVQCDVVRGMGMVEGRGKWTERDVRCKVESDRREFSYSFHSMKAEAPRKLERNIGDFQICVSVEKESKSSINYMAISLIESFLSYCWYTRRAGCFLASLFGC
jgi:hypothetical protein